MKVSNMLLLKVDNREHKLKAMLGESAELGQLGNLSIVYENLVCGDFVVEYNGAVLLVLERKTLADLAASIRDGRYRVQKARMCEMHPVHSVMYVIEGALGFESPEGATIEGMDKKSLISCVINTMVRDNIKVVQVPSIEETFNFVVQLVLRIASEPAKYTSVAAGAAGAIAAKEDMIQKHRVSTKEDMLYYQLTQVPGISGKTADAFVKMYGSMANFYKQILPLEDAEKLKMLKNITIEDSKDSSKKRRINAKVAEAIVKFMF